MTNTEQQAPTEQAEPKEAGPFDGLKDAMKGLGKTVTDAGFSKVSGLGDRLTTKLSDFAEGKKGGGEDDSEGGGESEPGPLASAAGKAVEAKVQGENPATAAIKGAFEGVKNKFTGGGGGGKKAGPKYTNIVEWIDVGVPVKVAYNQWTQFEQWSEFMKKMENVQRNEDQGKVAFKAQVFLLHRSWESTLVEMVPDDHIVWQSTGQKGYINGGVTFHEIGPRLTRMCVVLEYHPQGFFEKTLNIWRSVGRASRRELKRYVHQVMTQTILDPDAVEGWRAEVRDKEIVRTHDEVVEEEQRQAEEEEQRRAEEEQAAQAEAEGAEDEGAEDEGAEDEAPADTEDAAYDDEADEGEQPAEGSDDTEDEYDEEGSEEEVSDDTEDEYDDEEGEEESDDDSEGSAEADDEYEDEGSDDEEYEDEESEGEESEGDGSEDEYEDEGSDDEGSEDEYEDEDEGDEEPEGDQPSDESTESGGDQPETGAPTPKDVASGSVHPPESTRPRRRQRA
jgi:hypothetical protein